MIIMFVQATTVN